MSGRILQALVEKHTPAKAAEWVNVDPASLPASVREAYDTYRRAAQAASALRTAFETAMTDAVDPASGERLAFGYKFGKLSMAIVPDDRPVRKPAVAPLSLADFKARR